MASVSGGDRLSAALKGLASKLEDATSVDVGFLPGSFYDEARTKPTALIAAIQEYGAPRVGIPPRPFFRNMIKKESGKWPKAISELLVSLDYDAAKTLDQVGQVVAYELQQSITDTNEPPLSPVTLMVREIVGPNGTATFADVMEARRRVQEGETAQGVSTKPLIWTGHLQNSVSYKVK